MRGTSTISAAGFDVTLNSANTFTGAVGPTSPYFTVKNASAIVLDVSTVTGTYVVTAGGAITQIPGVFNITRALTITAAGFDVTLNSANSFT